MKRLLSLFVGVLLVAAPVFAEGGKAAAGKTMSAMGKVTAVSADSVTVKGKTAEWTFTVDKSTVVTARGGTHKMEAMKADKKPTVITEFVSVGDDVSVKYHDMGATKHAASVRVTGGMAPMKMKKK